MTRIGLTFSQFMLALLIIAVWSLPLADIAQAGRPLTPSEREELEEYRRERDAQTRDKRDAENGVLLRGIYIGEVIKAPLKLNPVTGTAVDILGGMGFDWAKRKFFDTPHFNEATNEIKRIYVKTVNAAFSDRRDHEKKLADIDNRLTRARASNLFKRETIDTINELERKRQRQRRLIDATDDVIDTFNKRLEDIDEVKRGYDAGGDVPPGLDSLVRELNNDIKDAAKNKARRNDRTEVGEADEKEDEGPSCAELEAEIRRIENELKAELKVRRSDPTFILRANEVGVELSKLRAKWENCKDRTAKQGDSAATRQSSSRSSSRPAGSACATGADCTDGICAAGVCMREGAGGLILGE